MSSDRPSDPPSTLSNQQRPDGTEQPGSEDARSDRPGPSAGPQESLTEQRSDVAAAEAADPPSPGPLVDEQSVVPNAAAQSGATQPQSAQPSPPPGREEPSSDSHLVEQTKQQIRALVREIAQLAQSNVDLNDFFEGFLGRVVSALAAEGGAIWMLDESGRLELQYQIGIHKTGLIDNDNYQMQHALLLKKALSGGKPMLLAPHSGSTDDGEAGNPTDYLLLLGGVTIDQDVQGIVEVFQRPGAGPATQRGYLRFVVEMCEIVGDYLKNRRLRHYSDRQLLWQKLEKFISAVHASLDPKETAYTIVNEARRLIECDRVSVARRLGNKYRIEAVSGSDNLDPRATTIRELGRLATAVATAGEAIWYTGSSEDMPPQIEDALQSYVDDSHSKMVAVLPLVKPTDGTQPASEREKDRPTVVGALIVENIEDNRVEASTRLRVDVVVQHSSSALVNAEEHHGLFLMPLWRALGRATWVLRARTLPKTIAALATAMVIVMALILVPEDFDLRGTGKLQPELRRDVFAQVDGMVVSINVDHLERVTKNKQLAKLQNTEIDRELDALLGEQSKVAADLYTKKHLQLQRKGFTPQEKTHLQGEMDSLQEELDSLHNQIVLYKRKQSQLDVLSPLDGIVVTWDLRDQLMRRPVKVGQKLMTVVDPKGKWELEIHMPESRMGHINRAWNKATQEKTDLKAMFMLETDPGHSFVGQVVEIHGVADVYGEEGNTVKIRIAVNKSELPDLRPGTSVTAKIHCGRRSIGYVWLHDLIAWVQTNILFWF